MIPNQRGFSLIEILIAMTLLAIGGTFVVGKFINNLHEGEVNGTKIQISNLEGRLKEFRRKCGQYPTTEQGLDALLHKPSGAPECRDYPPDGFIESESVPKDAWDNDFSYESDGKSYEIISLGNDKQAGGEGYEADISSKTMNKKGGGGGGGKAAAAEVKNDAPAAE